MVTNKNGESINSASIKLVGEKPALEKKRNRGGGREEPKDKKINREMQRSLDLALFYFRRRRDIIDRLFLCLPEVLKITDPVSTLYRKKEIRKVIDWFFDLDLNSREIFKEYILNLTATAIYEEVYVKKIPLSVFESGAMSFGMCDKIVYFGQHYINMCTFRAKMLNLETINWKEVQIKYLIRKKDIKKMLETEPDADFNCLNDLCTLYTDMIFGYEGEHQVLLFNRKEFPLSILGAVVSYRGMTVSHLIDFPSFKMFYDKEARQKKCTAQYFVRPLQMIAMRAQKALCKAFYTHDMTEVDIYDGGDDDPLKNIENIENLEEYNEHGEYGEQGERDNTDNTKHLLSSKENEARALLDELKSLTKSNPVNLTDTSN